MKKDHEIKPLEGRNGYWKRNNAKKIKDGKRNVTKEFIGDNIKEKTTTKLKYNNFVVYFT